MDDSWKKYNNNFNEGLGTVYERVVINNLFDRIIDKYKIKNVLEVPVYGMAGITGINSIQFAKRGCKLTLVDNNKERVEEIERKWDLMKLGKNVEVHYVNDFSSIPFNDESFDFVWNFAALWHLKDAPQLIREMVRVSSKYVFISVQNTKQVGYYLRKYAIDKDLFNDVHEEWLNIELINQILRDRGMDVIERGVFDVPPWPDTAMPIRDLFMRIGLNGASEKITDEGWHWSIMEYYMGKDPMFLEKINKFMLVEYSPLPTFLKALWAHHRFMLSRKAMLSSI
ncbi:class I SAM-dependent methyltransferase [Candidatus Pacearchaeota archaeon]|nr:class I SAM-dependent methyltransferase [Candidatus Pacearchaeota archaeon]